MFPGRTRVGESGLLETDPRTQASKNADILRHGKQNAVHLFVKHTKISSVQRPLVIGKLLHDAIKCSIAYAQERIASSFRADRERDIVAFNDALLVKIDQYLDWILQVAIHDGDMLSIGVGEPAIQCRLMPEIAA